MTDRITDSLYRLRGEILEWRERLSQTCKAIDAHLDRRVWLISEKDVEKLLKEGTIEMSCGQKLELIKKEEGDKA